MLKSGRISRLIVEFCDRVQVSSHGKKARCIFCNAKCRLLCYVLGRRNDVTLHALMRPAFEKRQGTKSRSVVHRRCGGRYRELTDAHELEAE